MIHKPRFIRSQITARVEADYANGSVAYQCVSKLERQARWHPSLSQEKQKALSAPELTLETKETPTAESHMDWESALLWADASDVTVSWSRSGAAQPTSTLPGP